MVGFIIQGGNCKESTKEKEGQRGNERTDSKGGGGKKGQNLRITLEFKSLIA